MRVLLDTHTFIWWDIEPNRLSNRALALCQNPENQLVLSVVSVWEMIIKTQLGKMGFEKSIDDMVSDHKNTNRLDIMPVTLDHVLTLETLPLIHKDPFDRLLIAQAKFENISFISCDAKISTYPITIEW